MNTATAQARTTHRELSAAEAFLEIESRAISLAPLFDGQMWFASVDTYGEGHNKTRALSSLSATCATSLGAVSKLVRLLEQDGEKPQSTGK